MHNSLHIGLTGGIGSGKSTVTQWLAHKGISIIDADAISRGLTQENGLAIPTIRQQFGDMFITENNALDRVKMRQLVFDNPEAKSQLESIIHPLVRQEMMALAQSQNTSPYIVFDIPLLVESIEKYRAFLHRICVVDCDEATQIKRVQQRSGLTATEVQHIIRQQVSREERLSYADDVIFNGDGVRLEELYGRIDNLHLEWTRLVCEFSRGGCH